MIDGRPRYACEEPPRRPAPMNKDMTMHALSRTLIPSAALLLALAAGALAQPSPPPPPPPHAPLGGPAVDDVNLPGKGRTFGQGMDMDRKPAGRIDARLLQRAIVSLREDAPEDIALSDDQADEIRGIMDEFRAEMRAFRTEHAEELSRLRGMAGMQNQPPAPRDDQRERGQRRAGPPDGAGPNDPPPEGAPPRKGPRGERGPRPEPTVEQQAARQQLRELMAKGPNPEAYQARIWEALRPEQRDELNRRLEGMRKEMNAQQQGPEGERIGPPGGPGREAGQERKGPGEPGARQGRGQRGERMREAMKDPEKRERIMQRLQQRLDSLTPEQREKAMQRIERWLDEAPPAGESDDQNPDRQRRRERDRDREGQPS